MRQSKHISRMAQWLAGAAVLASTGAIAATPVQAQSGAPDLSLAISFDQGETQFRTYTHSPDPDSLYEYGESAAVRALTDGDITTNVELWYKAETPAITNDDIIDPNLGTSGANNSESVARNVGFTATNGNRQVRVSSVTADEWDVYGQQWVNEFIGKYTPFANALESLSEPAQVVFQESFRHAGLGDPNVAEFSLDNEGNITIQTVGFYDLSPVIAARATEKKLEAEAVAARAAAPLAVKEQVAKAENIARPGKVRTFSILRNYRKQRLSALSKRPNHSYRCCITVEQLEQKIETAEAAVEGLDAILLAIAELEELEETLQASEVAKVEIYENGELTATEYAYTFELIETGFVARDDGESYSGLAEWVYPGENSGTPSSEAVPEPGFLLGAAIAGGLFRAAKRRSQR